MNSIDLLAYAGLCAIAGFGIAETFRYLYERRTKPKRSRYALRCVRTGHFALHGKSFRTREKALRAAQKRIPAWAWAISPYELVEVAR